MCHVVALFLPDNQLVAPTVMTLPIPDPQFETPVRLHIPINTPEGPQVQVWFRVQVVASLAATSEDA